MSIDYAYEANRYYAGLAARARRHKLISFVKSGMRLVASALLIPFAPVPAYLLIAAEVFGVIEEIGT